jgi:hypothetical protein
MTNRTDVAMRLRTLKFLLRHFAVSCLLLRSLD